MYWNVLFRETGWCSTCPLLTGRDDFLFFNLFTSQDPLVKVIIICKLTESGTGPQEGPGKAPGKIASCSKHKKKNTIPNWKESTKSQVYQSITGTIYRASVTSVKWDVCTEPRLKDNTHPATVCSPCCRLTTDTQVPAARPPPPAASLPRRYDSCISLCCRIANESRKIVFLFFFFHILQVIAFVF